MVRIRDARSSGLQSLRYLTSMSALPEAAVPAAVSESLMVYRRPRYRIDVEMDGRFQVGGRLRGMIRLTLGRMFEATVRNRSHELVFQEEVAESRRVNADIRAFLVSSSVATNGEITLRSRAAIGGCLGGLDLLIGVVDEIFLVRHGV